jgi:hypothetical protein
MFLLVCALWLTELEKSVSFYKIIIFFIVLAYTAAYVTEISFLFKHFIA